MDAWRAPAVLAGENCDDDTRAVSSRASSPPIDPSTVLLWTTAAGRNRGKNGTFIALGGVPTRPHSNEPGGSGSSGNITTGERDPSSLGGKLKDLRTGRNNRPLAVLRGDKLRVGGDVTNGSDVSLEKNDFSALRPRADPKAVLGHGVTDLSWASDELLLAATPRGSACLLRVSDGGVDGGDSGGDGGAGAGLDISVVREYRCRGSGTGSRAAVPGKVLETSRLNRVAASPADPNLFAALANLTVQVWDCERHDRPILSKKGSHAPSEAVTWNPHAPFTLFIGGHSRALKMLDLRVLGARGATPNEFGNIFLCFVSVVFFFCHFPSLSLAKVLTCC
jgi:hypothetical protein